MKKFYVSVVKVSPNILQINHMGLLIKRKLFFRHISKMRGKYIDTVCSRFKVMNIYAGMQFAWH